MPFWSFKTPRVRMFPIQRIRPGRNRPGVRSTQKPHAWHVQPEPGPFTRGSIQRLTRV